MKRKENGTNKKVLMLVNWKVHYCDEVPEGIQPPDYFVPGQPYWFFRYMSPEWKVDVVDITAPSLIARLEKRIRFYIWQTLRVLPKLGEYDLVVSHGMQSGIVLALWHRVLGKGHYRHIVFDIGAFNSGRVSGKALKLMQFASKSLDGVIYHTKNQSEYYRKCHPWLLGKSQFIPFGTDAEYFTPGGAKKIEKAQEKNDTPADDIEKNLISSEKKQSDCWGTDNIRTDSYILAFGKIKRDWNTLLCAYALSNQQFKLRIVGAKELILDDFKSKNVSFLENVEIYAPVPLNKLQEMIREAAFCVVPLAEFPYSYGQMTLLQQMSMGKAVIAADVSSLQAYHDGDGVLWYDSGNAKKLAEEMDLLASNATLRQRLGKKARDAIRFRFNEKKMAEEIEMFLRKVIAS